MAAALRPEYLGEIRTADDPEGYSRLHFTFQQVVCQAFIIRAVESGFIVCIPRKAAPETELASSAANAFGGDFGPWTEFDLKAVSPAGNEINKKLKVALIDCNVECFPLLSVEAPVDVDVEVLLYGTQRGVALWPSTSSARAALDAFLTGDVAQEGGGERLEAYFTGVSEVEDPGAAFGPPAGAAPAAPDPDLLQQLLDQSHAQSSALSGLQARLRSLDGIETRLKTLETKGSAAPAGEAGGQITMGSAAPAWAPQLFNEASQAHMDPAQAQRLLQLAGRGPNRLGDLAGGARPAARAADSPQVTAGLLSAAAAGAGAEVAEEDEPEATVGQDTSLLGKLLQQQTMLLTHLARKQQDPLQMLLGGGGEGGDTEFKTGGIKGMAARQLLQEQFAKQPLKVYQRVRERLALARRKGSARELEPRDMYLHFQETVPLGNFKTLTYLSFLMAEMFEAAERGQSDELLGLLALGLVFCEQVASEHGHTRLAWLLTCREDPTFALVEQRKAPRAELPHGHLSDPRWVAAQLGYLKDVDAIQERTNKSHLTRPPPTVPPGGADEGAARRPPKGRGRGSRATDETTS